MTFVGRLASYKYFNMDQVQFCRLDTREIQLFMYLLMRHMHTDVWNKVKQALSNVCFAGHPECPGAI